MRVAVITGAAQGIGRRTAEVLRERKYALALIDVRTLDDTCAALKQRGAEIIEFLGDASDEGVVTRFAEVVRARWGRADVLVNNAGISFIAPAEKTALADLRRVLEVNLIAAIPVS